MKKYVLSIDQGTTSTRAVIFDAEGNLVEKAQREIKLIYPHNGWVEADAIDIWISVVECINELLIKANITWNNINSIGITNQRETIVAFNKETGMPIYNAIIWQSKQTEEICDRYQSYDSLIKKKTGLRINPYFSFSKILFILENVKDAKILNSQDKLCFATMDSWILYKLTNGSSFKTDASNASRTLLFNINTMEYDQELLRLFGIKEGSLPEVCESSCDFGSAEYFSNNVPITALIGDQQGALFGQVCFNEGDFKTTYGTGCFLLVNTGNKIIESKNGLLSTVAWKINGETVYALEGSVFIGGASVQWLRDQLQVITDACESEKCATQCRTTRGVYFVPAFVGLGAPYWDDDARGMILGLTRASNKNHIIRATLDSIAYQTKDIIEVMKKDAHIKMKTLKADGGATDNDYLMQFQADICNMKVILPRHLETTALGAAYLAGLRTGFFKSKEQITRIHQIKKTFTPSMPAKEAKELYYGWKLAVKTARTFKLIKK